MFYIPSGSNDHSNDDNDNNSESDDSEDDDYDDESDVEEDDDEDDEDGDDVEIFKRIDGYPNYSVSNYGNVRNDKFNRLLKPGKDKDGYHIVVRFI